MGFVFNQGRYSSLKMHYLFSLPSNLMTQAFYYFECHTNITAQKFHSKSIQSKKGLLQSEMASFVIVWPIFTVHKKGSCRTMEDDSAG